MRCLVVPTTAFILVLGCQRSDGPQEGSLVAAAMHGEKGPIPGKTDVIPQGSQGQRESQRKEQRAWLRQTVRDMYDQVGNRDPRWDADARQALDAICRFWVNPEWRGESEVAWTFAEKAIKVGCTDPFIKYLYIRMAPPDLPADMTKVQQRAFYQETAEQMSKSGYTAYRKAMTTLKAGIAGYDLNPQDAEAKQKLAATIDGVLGQFPEVLKDKNPYALSDAFDLCQDLISCYEELGIGRKGLYDKVIRQLEMEPGSAKLALLVKGHFYIDYAWDARGSRGAAQVTDQGWKDMGERLQVAEAALEEAWTAPPESANPLNATIATKMITVELGQGRGRERMELWFQRAMQADPDNIQACFAKMTYVEPKWYGSPKELLAFGRAGLQTQNWGAQLPFLLVHAHNRLSVCLNAEQQKAYFQQPDVRQEIKNVFDEHLRRFPDDRFLRTAYLQWAVRMSDREEAYRQLNALGKNPCRIAMTADTYTRLLNELAQGGPKRPPIDNAGQ